MVDISRAALDRARTGLAEAAAHVEFVVADLREHRFSRRYDLWHDRAVSTSWSPMPTGMANGDRSLSGLLQPEFALISSTLEDHRTPSGAVQQFLWTHWRHDAES